MATAAKPSFASAGSGRVKIWQPRSGRLLAPVSWRFRARTDKHGLWALAALSGARYAAL